MPEYPLACWWDEWPEPRVPLGEAQMKYASKPVPEGAKFRNAPLLAAGIGILRVCHLLRCYYADDHWLWRFSANNVFDQVDYDILCAAWRYSPIDAV